MKLHTTRSTALAPKRFRWPRLRALIRVRLAPARIGSTQLDRVRLVVAGTLLTGLTLAGPAQAELAVIVNSSYTASSASAGDVKALYLGKSKSIGGGARLKPVDQSKGSGARAEFLSTVLDKNESQLKSYWSRLIFSGKGRPPAAVKDDAAVRGWVSSNANSIGYIDASQVDDSVKVLLRIP